MSDNFWDVGRACSQFEGGFGQPLFVEDAIGAIRRRCVPSITRPRIERHH